MNAATNRAILASVDNDAKTVILASIGRFYGISENAAYREVTDPEAEYLLDYMTGAQRLATSALIQRNAKNIAHLLERQNA